MHFTFFHALKRVAARSTPHGTVTKGFRRPPARQQEGSCRSGAREAGGPGGRGPGGPGAQEADSQNLFQEAWAPSTHSIHYSNIWAVLSQFTFEADPDLTVW